MNPLVQYWYFHIPNFVLAAVMYTMLGRIILSFLAPAGWNNYIWRAFIRITEPAVRATQLVTPAIVPSPLVLVFAFLWLMILRITLFVILAGAGLLPVVAPSAGAS
jgi:uncharacterized protein YggT (Ycf19 family)